MSGAESFGIEPGSRARFERPEQSEAAFLSAATSAVNSLEAELGRAKPEARGNWRALEIGCGAGRLMRPMARHFAGIVGVDPRPELVEQARENLADISNARVEAIADASLDDFEDASFDFVYSYGFFPYAESRESVRSLLREIQRVLSTGGLARLHFNGLPPRDFETPAPMSFTSHELLEFADSRDLQVLALQGASTQALWTTWRKPAPGWREIPVDTRVTIRRITNAFSLEPVAPSRGRFASIAIRTENLPPQAGLNQLRVTIGSSLGTITSIGAPDRFGAQRITVDLPELEATGLLPVQIFWRDEAISDPAPLRVIPPGPLIPRITQAPRQAGGRRVHLTLEEIARPFEVEISIDEFAVDVERLCTDPRPQRYDVSFLLPEAVGPGSHKIHVNVGRRRLAPVPIEVR